MLRIFTLPKHQAILGLVLIFFVAFPHQGIWSFGILLLCLLSTISSDLLFTYLRSKKLFIPRSGVITGLILTLIVDPSALWYQIVFISVVAMIVKNFLRIGKRHIFNPAAGGLFVGWVAFGIFPSWWAPSPYTHNFFDLPNLLVVLSIVLFAYVSCFRLKRYWTALIYLFVYLVLLKLTNFSSSASTIIATIISPGTLFYALVMLCEPMTSPVSKYRQMMYGGIVAILSFVLVTISSATGFTFFDASLVALLIGNLLFFKFR